MRKAIVVLMVVFMSFTMSYAEGFNKSASGKPTLLQEGPQKHWCPVCGMNIKKFYKTSHALELKGESHKQYCSIRCMINDYQELKSMVKNILVVDAKTEKIIDARKAYYVIGSKAPGTMTKISKYAFAEKKDAEAFRDAMGGELISFDAAADSAIKSMSKDIAMTNKKRQKMMYPMGKKIVSKACSKDLDPHSFKHINQLKAFIKDNNKCGQLKEKQLQAVALYLWDIERKSGEHKHEFITVGKDEKCPVCGMFVYKYPRWAAKVTFTKDQNQSHAVFDGVKDLLKFYFNPAKWGDFKNIEIKNIDVTDYYTQKSIDGKTAYYVIGSDVYGPMGKEFIPFSSKADAETFIKDHQGQKILSFNQITEKLTYDQDD